ncbi:MAG TPA: PAS domain S-box protein [Solirubrobacteraceae bacterium]
MSGAQVRLELFGSGGTATADDALEFIGNVLDSSTECSIVATDPDGVILLWNEGARRLYGYEPSEVVGRPSSDLHTRADASRGLPQAMRDQAVRHGNWEGTIERIRKDGSSFTASVVLTPRLNHSGLPIGFLLISRDITNQLELTAELERSRFTQSVLESAPDAMVIVNRAGAIAHANAEMVQLFGYRREELVGCPVDMLIPDRYRDRHPVHRARFAAEPRPRPMGAGRQLWGRRKDGVEIPVEISLSPLETAKGRLTIAAIRDVTDRELVARELREANTKLEAAVRAKDDFLASMSHELRTPLSAILGFTGTMLMGLPGPLTGEQTTQLEIVRTSGRHLLSLINDLLDLARIGSGKVEPRLESVDCHALLDDVAVGLRQLAEQKGLELEVVECAGGLQIQSDRRALNQILINLAHNAIKFTEVGAVRLGVAKVGVGDAATRFTVTDTGVGIDAADIHRLFDAFEQVESPTAELRVGSGLGLHISQALAGFLGGVITCESELGRGSRFMLEIPD